MAQQSTQSPSIPPVDGSAPITKLPFELRRQVFLYLLPSKHFSIEPVSYSQRRKAVRKQRVAELQRLHEDRRRHHQQIRNTMLAHSQFHGNHAGPINNAGPTNAVQVPFNLNAPVHTFQTPANITVNPIATGQAPLTTGNPFAQHNILTLWPNQVAHLNATAVAMNNTNAVAVAAVNNNAHATNLSNDDEDPEQDMELQRALRTAALDPTAECMAMALLLTNKLFCNEVSQTLYEEYTFEIHIHANGVDLLHFPQIPTLESYGQEIANTMGVFKTTGHFCFHRMNHLEFVLWGGDPKDRTAGMRMVESVRKLVNMRQEGAVPLTELKIRFELEETPFETDEGEANEYYDEIGTFWTNKIRKEARASIQHGMSMVQLLCTPFEVLREVHAVSVALPEGIKTDNKLLDYAAYLTQKVKGNTALDAADKRLLQLERIFTDSRWDYDMQHSEYPSGGYYNPQREASGKPEIPLLTEQEVADDADEMHFNVEDMLIGGPLGAGEMNEGEGCDEHDEEGDNGSPVTTLAFQVPSPQPGFSSTNQEEAEIQRMLLGLEEHISAESRIDDDTREISTLTNPFGDFIR